MQKLCSDLQQPQSEIPIVLLYGPPGTGKTRAVECLASTACQAFTLNARQLVTLGLFGKFREAIRYGVLLHVAQHRRHLRFMPRLRLPMKEGCVGSGWMQGIATQAHTKQEARPGPERVR